MNFFRIVIELFTLYLLYKLVFDFIIPVARTTKQVKKQFGEMNSRMQEHMNQQQPQPQQPWQHADGNKKTGGSDYIEFEEIK
jgi:hypothetical protein